MPTEIKPTVTDEEVVAQFMAWGYDNNFNHLIVGTAMSCARKYLEAMKQKDAQLKNLLASSVHDLSCIHHSDDERKSIAGKDTCPVCLHSQLKIAVEALEVVQRRYDELFTASQNLLVQVYSIQFGLSPDEKVSYEKLKGVIGADEALAAIKSSGKE